ncbi:hypothetical protein B9G55_05200 [Saccharibacillus sp. O16]|nr:hypothetical protein B9G55_05200 [Saccharibacillus sp. O16]
MPLKRAKGEEGILQFRPFHLSQKDRWSSFQRSFVVHGRVSASGDMDIAMNNLRKQHQGKSNL